MESSLKFSSEIKFNQKQTTEFDSRFAAIGSRVKNVESFLSAVDFAQIVLFKIAIFFVVHALYLIKLSLSIESLCPAYFAEKTSDLRNKVQEMYQNYRRSFWFRQQYLPFSTARDLVEFSLIHSLFYSAYALPKEFNFAVYLSGSFARFLLKLIK